MIRDSEDPMTPNTRRKIDELASDIDDLATTAEELQTDPTTDANAAELEKLQRALEEASDATDALDEELDEH
jgi:outer membrane murein-binding lipoprotein Lpp